MIYSLSFGANIGNREQTLQQALEMIEQQIGHVLRCSSYYYSEPWGFVSTHPFCNLCCAVETGMAPLELLSATQAIEKELGRTHKTVNKQYTDRTIDIDIILAFDNKHKSMTIDSPTLIIPHPLWEQRDFVKVPLNEILESTITSEK